MGELTFGSLFSGIGGMDLGLERAGWTCAWQVETDEYARAVLERHWPNVTKYKDVRDISATELQKVDLLCGGFPCQDISDAGTKRGLDGERSGLWSEFARLIRELRPRYVLVENSAALRRRGLNRILSDLSTSRYNAEWDCLPAAAFGAPHTRDRLFLVATDSDTLNGKTRLGIFENHKATLLAAKDRYRAQLWLAPPHVPARMGHGPSCWLERRQRTEVVGGCVVPQIVEWIGRILWDELSH